MIYYRRFRHAGLVAGPLLAVAVLASGCGGTPGPDPAPSESGTAVIGAPSDSASPSTAPTIPIEDVPASWEVCQYPPGGFAVGHPGDWYTATGSGVTACSMFHPDPFTIPANAEYPRVALMAVNIPESFAAHMASLTDPMFQTTILNEATTVAGRPAARFEISSTGEGLDEAGTRRYGYILDMGTQSFALYTTAVAAETRYDDWKFVIDTAKGTLKFLH
jgi:hypothetical protein